MNPTSRRIPERYLITSILLQQDRPSLRPLGNFWVRRIFRIWPVFYLTLAAVLLPWLATSLADGSGFTLGKSWKFFCFLQFTEGYWTRTYSGTEGFRQQTHFEGVQAAGRAVTRRQNSRNSVARASPSAAGRTACPVGT